MISKKKAVELSIKKWEWIVGNGGKDEKADDDGIFELIDAIPELTDIAYNCGMCQYMKDRNPEFCAFSDDCKPCPLYKMNLCGKYDSSYDKWDDHKDNQNYKWALYHAKKILAELLKIKEEHA